jgi:hypothetical protein
MNYYLAPTMTQFLHGLLGKLINLVYNYTVVRSITASIMPFLSRDHCKKRIGRTIVIGNILKAMTVTTAEV